MTDRDLERLARAARRKHLVLRYGPFAAMALLLGIIALAQGAGFALFAALGLLIVIVGGKLSEAYRSVVDRLFRRGGG